MDKECDATFANVVKVDFRERRSLHTEDELNDKKRELFDQWLQHGTVCVLLDARMEGVKVPPQFKNRGDLRLNFCYEFDIADFNFNAEHVWATLSFDEGEFFCLVSWASVYGMQCIKLNQGAVWFESFPKDYSQLEILGFSEEMCEDVKQDSADVDILDTPMADVVRLDFSKMPG